MLTRREGQAVHQVFDLVVGAANDGDGDGVTMREHGQGGLVHDARTDVLVEVAADQRLVANGGGVGILVRGEALSLSDFGEREEILGGFGEAGVRRRLLGSDDD